jgi:GntR family transcriptional regulator
MATRSPGPVRPDRRDPVPLWAQVLQDLRRRLEAGEFADGFPTDNQLMAQYDVSRHTVREAVRRLHEAGVVERTRGRGTVVAAASIEQPVGVLYSLFRSIEEQGYTQTSDVLTLEETTEPDAADRLGVDPGAPLVHLARVRRADDTPIAVDELWLPAELARPLLQVDFSHTAVYVELDRLCGIRPTGGWERILPGLASPRERARLGRIPASQPVFVVERFTESAGRPLEFRRSVIRGDQYAFVARWSAHGGVDSGLVPVGSSGDG